MTRAGLAALLLLAVACALAMLGPSGLRIDLRLDLSRLEMLRALPLPGWRVVAAGLLAPGVVLAALEGALVLLALALAAGTGDPAAPRLALALGLLPFLPALTLANLCVHNALVVLFPAWLPEREESVRGIEALGQRLLTLLGTLLVLAVGLLPAGMVGALVGLLLARLVGPPGWAAAGWAAAAVLLAEAAVAVALLGRAFDRMDVSAEEGHRGG